MTDFETLQTYRELVLELQELEEQLRLCGTNGGPRGYAAFRPDTLPGTNDPAAAALQLADGLESMAARKRAELARLAPEISRITGKITQVKMFTVIHQYYVLARCTADIADFLLITPRSVNRLKHQFQQELERAERHASSPVPACPTLSPQFPSCP